ncbi:MAG TPA: hypothetical protein VHS99_12170, partial [Chloroflexota bacterium]|nr:hypothetical protein [Chloroflexota bacterium]
MRQGDAAGAAAAARRGLEVAPRGMAAQRCLGLALLDLGEVRPALSAFQAALAGDPLDIVSQVGIAEAQEAIGGVASAVADWQRAWELEPGRPAVEERLQAARQARGEAGAPGRPPPFTSAALARVYLRGGLHEHAVAEARSALVQDPERTDVQLVLAEACWRAGDGAAAAAVAENLLERLPDCAAANLLLAAYWQAIGRDPEPLLARVRAVDPEGEASARLFGNRETPPPLEVQLAPPAEVPAPSLAGEAFAVTGAVATPAAGVPVGAAPPTPAVPVAPAAETPAAEAPVGATPVAPAAPEAPPV